MSLKDILNEIRSNEVDKLNKQVATDRIVLSDLQKNEQIYHDAIIRELMNNFKRFNFEMAYETFLPLLCTGENIKPLKVEHSIKTDQVRYEAIKWRNDLFRKCLDEIFASITKGGVRIDYKFELYGIDSNSAPVTMGYDVGGSTLYIHLYLPQGLMKYLEDSEKVQVKRG